jgi:hypothetical protein
VYIETLYTTPFNPNSPPSPGVISARLTNLDSVNTEKMYGLQPSNQTKYFIWVDADSATNQMRWTLLAVPVNPGGGLVRATHQEPLTICAPNTPGEAIIPEVDFMNFKHPQGCISGPDTGWVQGPAPIWKKCSTGCCA